MQGKSLWVSVVLAAGLVLTWAGERIAEAGNTRLVLSALGGAALLAALDRPAD